MQKEPFKLKENEYLQIQHWMNQNPDLIAGFTTRNGGVSKNPYLSLNLGFHVHDEYADVLENRHVLAAKLQFDLNNWVVAEQVHDAKIKKISRDEMGKGAFSLDDAIRGVDGLYTSEKGILLTSLYADCTPLYFYSQKDEIIGLAHAGWRGTVACIGSKMIDLWIQQEKVDKDNIQVVIGPSISKQAYQVDDLVIEKVNQVLDEQDNLPYEKISQGQYLLDLKYLNYLLLIQSGLDANQIIISNYCTAKESSLFYSHRREQGKTGRMMSFIGYRNS